MHNSSTKVPDIQAIFNYFISISALTTCVVDHPIHTFTIVMYVNPPQKKYKDHLLLTYSILGILTNIFESETLCWKSKWRVWAIMKQNHICTTFKEKTKCTYTKHRLKMDSPTHTQWAFQFSVMNISTTHKKHKPWTISTHTTYWMKLTHQLSERKNYKI